MSMSTRYDIDAIHKDIARPAQQPPLTPQQENWASDYKKIGIRREPFRPNNDGGNN